jgi:hypothetical protein
MTMVRERVAVNMQEWGLELGNQHVHIGRRC